MLNEIGYLELRAAGLGRRFFGEVKSAERVISQFPESAAEISLGIRKHPLHKFRSSLIYTNENDQVLILTVAHHSRRLDYWVGRVGEPGRICRLKTEYP